MAWKGEFFDGQSADKISVNIAVEDQNIAIRKGRKKLALWAISDVKALRDEADQLLRLDHEPSGGRATILDAGAISELESAHPEIFKYRLGHNNRKRLLLWGGGSILATLLVFFVLLPSLVNFLALYIPQEKERALGLSLIEQIDEFNIPFADIEFEFCQDEGALTSLDKLKADLMDGIELDYQIDLHIINSDEINAFALPGGQIVFFKGLIDAAEEPEEVAAVLAHEIGHVENRDPMRGLLGGLGRGAIISILIGDATGGALMAVIGETLIQASYSQEAETQADHYAIDVLNRQHVSTEYLAGFFDKIREEYGDVDGVWTHFSTHPQLASRAEISREHNDFPQGQLDAFSAEDWQKLRAACSEE